jgi:CheY-like chemotaxis protein
VRSNINLDRFYIYKGLESQFIDFLSSNGNYWIKTIERPKNYFVILECNEDGGLGKTMKILVADDERDCAMLYHQVLERRGHDVIVAETGEQCLKIYNELLPKVRTASGTKLPMEPFDAIILDYNIPDRNGLEIASEILSLCPHQRIIFVSAYLKDTVLQSIRQLHAAMEVMEKPISNDSLVQRVEDTNLYEELKKFNMDTVILKKAGLSHEALQKILDTLQKNSDQGKANK